MIHYNKLIRDKIPAMMDTRGVEYSVRELPDEEYETKLNEKLHEELREYMEAPHEEKLEELADLVEVIHALVLNSGNTLEHFEQLRKQKLVERGGFEQKLLLVYTE
ncbi:MAG: phosphoribosyl-ATP pyrophosphohydrolase [Paenibacillus sp.]|jgi:predicted house-cleaning noncanonical NTP pyrophosphatase (MazG superfamily)|uniref:nucleoside triphosphate pyrophosphohydrolase n=1 Tax=Paenibacillus sp. GCM10012303 TaxID=3317340 RepID=UPI0029F15672|nr:phosphoribosyl-ATP pyrophosphohydrolase [Paenibacillus sp.]